MTMNFKPTFWRTIASGRSVVFLPTRAVLDVVHQTIMANCIAPVMIMHPGRDTRRVLALWEYDDGKDGVLLIQQPMLAHGVHMRGERVIWIGEIPQDPGGIAVYVQSMARVDRIGLPAVRLGYQVEELLFVS